MPDEKRNLGGGFTLVLPALIGVHTGSRLGKAMAVMQEGVVEGAELLRWAKEVRVARRI